MSGPSFNAGRDIKGAFATGDGSSAVSTHNETIAADPTVDIVAELKALRLVIEGVPNVSPNALTRIDGATQEATRAKPKQAEVHQLLTQAVRYASEAASRVCSGQGRAITRTDSVLAGRLLASVAEYSDDVKCPPNRARGTISTLTTTWQWRWHPAPVLSQLTDRTITTIMRAHRVQPRGVGTSTIIFRPCQNVISPGPRISTPHVQSCWAAI